MTTNQTLFVNLMYRLKSFRNVTVLNFLLEVGAEQKEYSCSAQILAHRYLGNQLSARQVEKALSDLIELGLITTRVHANTKTHMRVNAEAVKTLLSQPLPPHLPGMDDLNFSFLNEWQADKVNGATNTEA